MLVPSVTYSQESLADRLKRHVYTIADDSLKGRKAGSVYAQKAADYIASQWEEIGITNKYYLPFMHKYGKYQNLVGVIEGSHPVLKNEYIIVGAHYDHLGYNEINDRTVIYNGADDNASGTAVIIELARKLKEIQPTLFRTVVLIAFDAEEIGLHGSNNFAENPPFPINDVAVMFSVDMVGWYETSGYVKYTGVGTIKNGNQIVSNSTLNPEGLNVKTQRFERGIFTATDTYGFARRGRPTLSVTTGVKSPYHKPEDKADLIDYEGMAQITEHLTNLVQNMSRDEKFKASGKIAPNHKPPSLFNFAISANIGSNYHHYTKGALDGKSATSVGTSLSMDIGKSLLALRSEVFYDFIQAHHPDGKIKTHNVTGAINLMLQAKSFSSAIAIFAGPYYSYRFDGKQGKSSLDFENLFNRKEIGLNYGVEARMSPFRLGLSYRRELSTFTQTKNDDGSHIRNRVWFTSLSYMF